MLVVANEIFGADVVEIVLFAEDLIVDSFLQVAYYAQVVNQLASLMDERATLCGLVKYMLRDAIVLAWANMSVDDRCYSA
jgi:hypothetical protein